MIALTKHAKGWKKSIGSQLWYFGHDEQRAQTAAQHVTQRWMELQQAGNRQWPEDVRLTVMRERDAILQGVVTSALPAPFAPAVPSTPAIPNNPSGMTLYKLLDDYSADLDQRVPSEIAASNAYHQKCAIRALRRYVADCPLASIGADWIRGVVRHYASRPLVKGGGRKKGERGRMAVLTVVGHVAVLRMVLGWAADRSLWAEPPRFFKLFKVNRRGIMTLEERSAVGQHTLYSIEDLAKLYRSCSDRHKGWILCGLNFAFCNGELAEFLVREVNFATGTVTRTRNKTGVKMSWPMWAETKAILEKLCHGKSPNARIFNRPDGKPLIHHTTTGRVDEIGHLWKILNRRAGITGCTYKSLRKLSAQLVRDAGGKDISEQHLAHAVHDISIFYTKESGDRLMGALAKVRQQLQPLFDPAPVEGAVTIAA